MRMMVKGREDEGERKTINMYKIGSRGKRQNFVNIYYIYLHQIKLQPIVGRKLYVDSTKE
jgi:hypothetical protein